MVEHKKNETKTEIVRNNSSFSGFNNQIDQPKKIW